ALRGGTCPPGRHRGRAWADALRGRRATRAQRARARDEVDPMRATQEKRFGVWWVGLRGETWPDGRWCVNDHDIYRWEGSREEAEERATRMRQSHPYSDYE